MELTIALSKGRILEDSLPLLRLAGIEILENINNSRKLIFKSKDLETKILLVRSSDVPVYVKYGGADLGVAGLDNLLEFRATGIYQPLDLNIAKCRLSVATKNDFDYFKAVKQGARLTVATKYINLTQEFFAEKGIHVDIVKLYGSMELAPLTGMADLIVDLVSTGNTLRANNLKEVEKIMNISSYLIVNRVSLKMKQAKIRYLIEKIKENVSKTT